MARDLNEHGLLPQPRRHPESLLHVRPFAMLDGVYRCLPRVPVLAFVATLIACGGSVSTEAADAAVNVEDAFDSLSLDARPLEADADAGRVSVCTHCPAALPRHGSPCPYTEEGYIECSYGSNPVPWCRPRALCGFDGWRVFSGSECLATTCPTTAAPGAACEDFSGSCYYADGTLCTCARGRTECHSPNAGCPPLLPNTGDRCTGEVRTCGYGAITVGPDAIIGVTADCRDGCWQLGFLSGK